MRRQDITGFAAIVVAVVSSAAPLSAQDTTDSPSLSVVFAADTRLRYEFAESDDQPLDGEALTLRIRPSVEIAPIPEFSILAEAEGIISVLPDSRNGFLGAPGRPPVADEETLELNRLQVEFAPTDAISVVLGRQRIALDDERFIGIVDFRQNQQTYDAVTASLGGPGGLIVQGGYIWRVGRVLGPERPDGVFDSDSFYVNAALPLPIGQVSAFHYDLDLDDRVNPVIRSQTTGASVRGRAFPGEVGLFWEAGYARQSAEGATPEFVRAAFRAERGEVSFSLKYEELGSDNGVAFQTPLATLHRFQGAADLFLLTPPEGIEDIEARATWRIGSLGAARGTRISLQYNAFSAAAGRQSWGDEWGAEFATTIASTRLSIAAARYSADGFGADTTRVWLTAERKF